MTEPYVPRLSVVRKEAPARLQQCRARTNVVRLAASLSHTGWSFHVAVCDLVEAAAAADAPPLAVRDLLDEIDHVLCVSDMVGRAIDALEALEEGEPVDHSLVSK